MTQPSFRAAMQKVLRASSTLMAAGQNSASSLYWLKTVASPVSCCSKKQTHSSSSSQQDSPSRKVVSVSSIFQQDGLDIQELPILVRLLDKSMVPLANYTYSGEQIRPMTAEDENFQFLLQQCESVRDVLELLEIPSERVTGYSASAALMRICELQKMSEDWDNLHSFIRTAVMKELNDTVRKDVEQLSNQTLMALVSCYLNMDSFGQEAMSAVNGEIEKRMVEEQFQITDLCSLSKLLQSSNRGDKSLMDSIWAHIANHYPDIQESNIAGVLDSVPSSHKYMMSVLNKQVSCCWWKMNERDVVSCLSTLVKHNSLNVAMMFHFSQWLFLNIHTISEDGLMHFLSTFTHFNYYETKFISAIERYIGARRERLNTDLLALVLEYCGARRYFSPTILDAAAVHFVAHSDLYTPFQTFCVLRMFGKLNYLPKDCHQLLLKTESQLEKQYNGFKPHHLVELLCSFAFVQKFPLNFVDRVLTPSFYSRLKEAPNESEAEVWLEMLQSALLLETRGVRISHIFKKSFGIMWFDERQLLVQSKIQKTLEVMFGNNYFRVRAFAPNTVHTIDVEVHVTKEGKLVPVRYHDGKLPDYVATRLAILILRDKHYCVNSGHLLGEFAMRRRHLTILGYKLVEVYDMEFMRLPTYKKDTYLMERLSKWVSRDNLLPSLNSTDT